MKMEKMLNNKNEWRAIFLWGLIVTILQLTINCFRQFVHYGSMYDAILFFIPFALILMWGIFAGLRYADSDYFLRDFTIIKNPFVTLLIITIFFHASFSLMMAIFDPIGNVGFIEDLLRIFVSFSLISVYIISIPFFIGYVPAILLKFISNYLKNKLKNN